MDKLKTVLGNIANLKYIGGNSKNLKFLINSEKWLGYNINIEKTAGIYIISNPINTELKKIGFASLGKILERLSDYGTYYPIGVNIEGLILFDFTNYPFTMDIINDFKMVIKGESEYNKYFPENIKIGYNQLKRKKEKNDYLEKIFSDDKELYLSVLARTLEYDLHTLLQKYKKNIRYNTYSTKSQIKSENIKVRSFGEYFKITNGQFLDELKKWNIHFEYGNAYILLFTESFFFGEYIKKPENIEYSIYINKLNTINRKETKNNIKKIKIDLDIKE
jgi:hypothetical protein